MDKTRFKDHELIDQPIGFIFFVMADEPDPLRSIDQMRKELHKTAQYRDGVYADNAANAVQEFVMVLNHHNESSSTYKEAVDTIGQKFHRYQIFEVPMSDRTRAHSADNKNEDIWLEKYIDLDSRALIDARVAMTDPSSRKVRGKAFSAADRLVVKAHIKRMAEAHLIPFMKTKIKTLDDVV